MRPYKDVAETTLQISLLLRECNLGSKAEWLDERLADLQTGGSDRRLTAMAELHSVVPGMGGLVDLASGLATAEARDQLEVLAERLYELTRM